MKKTVSLLAALAVVVSMASCGSGNTPAQTTAQVPASQTQASASDPQKEVTEAAQSVSAEKTIPEDSEYKIENGITERMKALSELNTGNRARLAEVFRKAREGKPITVAYLGGSITQGSSAGNDLCYAKLTTDWLKEQFPSSKITYVNAGIGATGSYIGVFRTDRDVLSHDPDLVFIDFSVNDTTEHTQRNIESYDGVLRKIWEYETKPAIVTIAMTMDNGVSFQDQHYEICKAYDIPMISYRNAILDVIKQGHITWKDISDDNIHPNVTGHKVLTQIITSYLGKVIDDLDSIDTSTESDFSSVYSSDKYSTAQIIVPETAENVSCTGWETKTDIFGNFGGYWMTRSNDGTFEGVEPIKVTVEAGSVGIFYGKLTKGGGKFDVLIDGNKMKTIDCSFPGGWGNYMEAEEIYTYEKCGEHTIEIVPVTGEKSIVYISAIAITK